MIFLYNFLQILSAPLLLVFGACGLFSDKYRGRLAGRLGIGLAELVPKNKKGIRRIWIHALSVGEVRSASVLLETLARQYPNVELVLSATTRTGITTAQSHRQMVRFLVPYPLDFRLSVRRFLDRVEPDLFVLVETDFWPNFLWQLHDRKIPAVLVNGRISEGSWRGYRAARLFFRPLFDLFARLYLQTEEDAARMRIRLRRDHFWWSRAVPIPAKRRSCSGHLPGSAGWYPTAGWSLPLGTSGGRPASASLSTGLDCGSGFTARRKARTRK
ncbi:MAG: glycosyltransferase N-terminal domain-containing protein [Deltaproteobacteria bacterium]